jgi:hypothetical protein
MTTGRIEFAELLSFARTLNALEVKPGRVETGSLPWHDTSPQEPHAR